MRGGSLNALWSEAFFDELARAGVRVVCIAPGSRSTPLVLAAARDGRFRLISVIDERSAGFVGLGVGKGSGSPAVVITTSGTAGANLYPAVIEAAQAEVPLIVLTADRPHRLRDTDGNQSMDQLRLFGSFPRAFFEVAPPRAGDSELGHLRGLAARAVALSSGPPAGPIHLNFPFEKPLEPDQLSSHGTAMAEPSPGGAQRAPLTGRRGSEPYVSVPTPASVLPADTVQELRDRIRASERGVIVAGPVPNSEVVGAAVLELAQVTGFPVLADPLSGARFLEADEVYQVARYDLFLRSESARTELRPDLILRIGGSPTSAGALQYLNDHRDAGQIVIDEGLRWKDHLSAATDYLRASPAHLLQEVSSGLTKEPNQAWTARWKAAENAAEAVAQDPPGDGLLEGQVLSAVVGCLPPEANLLVASSMPIRDLDAFVPSGPHRLRVFGNRGVSGIDGLVSTTVGLALTEPSETSGSPTVGVIGDLALLHDVNGLQALQSAEVPVVLVVVNNDGGGIFQTLPVRDNEPAFTRFFSTPHGMDFRHAAALYGLRYGKADDLEVLEQKVTTALASGVSTLLEVQTNKEVTHRRRKAVIDAVVSSVDRLWPGTDGPAAERPHQS
jgi:2-succinyl-5-enolpyruvyl-6-hydroxy-3-cyclohexene-1-carboxylate synthase